MSKRQELQDMLDKMTPEEERAYWDAQDPLRQGKKVRFQRITGPPDRMMYFALRLHGEDIDRLAAAAESRGMKPSELARALILQGLDQTEGQADLAKRVAVLEAELAAVKQRLDDIAQPVAAAS
ncbi:MAG: hypothetical protein HYY01_15110 [Chloroflexi bacterium]|nr:hypothetical protein [Chloroflexota bacterium]